jgi:hypothetical protein
LQAPFKPSQQQVQEYPYPVVGVLFGAPAAAAAGAAASPEYAPTSRRQAAARTTSAAAIYGSAAATAQTQQGPNSSSSRVLCAPTASFKNVSFAEGGTGSGSSSSKAAAAAPLPQRGLYRQTSKDEDSLLEAQQQQRKHRAPPRRTASSTQLGAPKEPDGVFERPTSLPSGKDVSIGGAIEPQQSLSPRPPLAGLQSGTSFRQRSGLPLGFGFGSGDSGGSAGNSSGSLPAVSPRAAAAAGVEIAPGSPTVSPRAAPATLEEVAARLGLFGSGGGSSSSSSIDRRQSTARGFAGQPSRLTAIPSTEVLPESSAASGLPRQAAVQQPSLAPAGSTTAAYRQKSNIGGTIWSQASGGVGAFSNGPAGGSNRVRSADEIRQAYGRPSLKANEVSLSVGSVADTGDRCSSSEVWGRLLQPSVHASAGTARTLCVV